MAEVATSVPLALKSYFDFLDHSWFDHESMKKRFPAIDINWKQYNLWDRIYESLFFDRLADIVPDDSMTMNEKQSFIEAYLDGIYTTVRYMLESLGVSSDIPWVLDLSDRFALLKDDIRGALLMYHPAVTTAAQTLDDFRRRAKWASGQ